MGINQTLAAKLRDYLAEHGPCPQTGGHPLRCTQAGFDRGCKYYRRKADHKSAFSYQSFDRCLACGGYPAEVEFINIEELTKKKTMATAKTNKGTCAVCQEKRSLKTHLGKDVCTTCSFVLTAAKNRPETLYLALSEFDVSMNTHIAEFCTQSKGNNNLSEEAKRTTADNCKSVSPEILKRLENLERLGVKIREMDDLHRKVLGFCAELSDKEVVA